VSILEPSELWQLDTTHIGRRVLVFDRLDSTSTLAASLANDPANDGVVILAKEQTAGRGQHGRNWTCPSGSGVLMSVLLFPAPQLRRPALLTAWAAVSVCETVLQAANLQARIKWPNDVLIQGRKVCGILIESRPSKRSELSVVAGVGLNVKQTAEMFVAAGLPQATSLAVSAGRDFDPAQVARLLIQRLDEEYGRLCTGDLATLEACWKWRVGLLGKNVCAECQGSRHAGRLLEMAWDGLLIEKDAELVRLEPEAVRHLEPL
jgi:BirA family transcriptional regulator, biotin operon repressor / biotin---[acetyl-CoA-carboxylase] ligase